MALIPPGGLCGTGGHFTERYISPLENEGIYHLKRDYFEKEISASNHQFSRDMLVFRGVNKNK